MLNPCSLHFINNNYVVSIFELTAYSNHMLEMTIPPIFTSAASRGRVKTFTVKYSFDLSVALWPCATRHMSLYGGTCGWARGLYQASTLKFNLSEQLCHCQT